MESITSYLLLHEAQYDIQKLREALPEQIRFFATTFDKETFLQRIQRICF